MDYHLFRQPSIEENIIILVSLNLAHRQYFKQDMAAYEPFFLCSVIITSFVVLFLVSLPTISSQIAGNTPSAPTVAGCGPSLLPLASCAPFVQGSAPLPVQQCCNNIKQLAQQQPGCLCLLLNGTTLRSFPINSTRALQLPDLCSLGVDIDTCGVTQGVSSPPSSPTSQVSFETQRNSTAAAAPMVSLTPQPTIMGFGFHPSAAVNLNAEYHSVVLLVTAMVSVLSKVS